MRTASIFNAILSGFLVYAPYPILTVVYGLFSCLMVAFDSNPIACFLLGSQMNRWNATVCESLFKDRKFATSIACISLGLRFAALLGAFFYGGFVVTLAIILLIALGSSGLSVGPALGIASWLGRLLTKLNVGIDTIAIFIAKAELSILGVPYDE